MGALGIARFGAIWAWSGVTAVQFAVMRTGLWFGAFADATVPVNALLALDVEVLTEVSTREFCQAEYLARGHFVSATFVLHVVTARKLGENAHFAQVPV